MKILKNEDFVSQINELGQLDWEVSESRGYPVLQQTKRNAVRQDLVNGLASTLTSLIQASSNGSVYLTDEGIAVEVYNDSVANKVKDSSGMITMILDIKFKSLDYDAILANEFYIQDQENKSKNKK